MIVFGVGLAIPVLVLIGLPNSVVRFGENLDVSRIVGGDDSEIKDLI